VSDLSEQQEIADSPIGRPSAYDPDTSPAQAEKLCALGATDEEVADFFEVDVRTIYRWKLKHEAFCQALKTGKELADQRVERSLYQKAIGYRQQAVKIFMPAGKEDPVYAPYVEHMAPDTTAAIFWLKNRRPDLWRDKSEHEHTGKNGGPIVTTQIDAKKLSKAQLEALATINLPPDRS
jgi:hypothetical protein